MCIMIGKSFFVSIEYWIEVYFLNFLAPEGGFWTSEKWTFEDYSPLFFSTNEKIVESNDELWILFIPKQAECPYSG